YSALRLLKTQKYFGKRREAPLSKIFLYYSKPQQAVAILNGLWKAYSRWGALSTNLKIYK
ncbi:MAG: hypothetical protein ACK48A_02450, partial [Pseudanabaena sp.]